MTSRVILAGAMLALIVGFAVPAAGLATGTNGGELSACVDKANDWTETDPRPEHWGFRGGVQVFAKDRWQGASRILCGATVLQYDYDPGPPLTVYFPAPYARDGELEDYNLNRRQGPSFSPGDLAVQHPLLDVWGGMGRPPKGKGIESLRAIVAAGCTMNVTLWGSFDGDIIGFWRLRNGDGSTPKTRKIEVPRRFWGVVDIVWRWKKVWAGDGYILKKVRVEVYGWVPLDNNASGLSLDTRCPHDTGDPDDYDWSDPNDTELRLKR